MRVITEFSEILKNFNAPVKVDLIMDIGLVADSFHITLKDYLKTIEDASDCSRQESPLLPLNCLKYIEYSSDRVKLYTVVEKRQWDIEFNEIVLKVGFPRLIFSWSIWNKDVTLDKIVAIKRGLLTDQSPLYHFPFSHVDHGSNNKVCMGGNVFPTITSLTQLETMHSLFFSAPFSTDYGAKTKSNKPIWQLFSEVCNEKDFDDELLVPTTQILSDLFK